MQSISITSEAALKNELTKREMPVLCSSTSAYTIIQMLAFGKGTLPCKANELLKEIESPPLQARGCGYTDR